MRGDNRISMKQPHPFGLPELILVAVITWLVAYLVGAAIATVVMS